MLSNIISYAVFDMYVYKYIYAFKYVFVCMENWKCICWQQRLVLCMTIFGWMNMNA